jgi:hypothetical protein
MRHLFARSRVPNRYRMMSRNALFEKQFLNSVDSRCLWYHRKHYPDPVSIGLLLCAACIDVSHAVPTRYLIDMMGRSDVWVSVCGVSHIVSAFGRSCSLSCDKLCRLLLRCWKFVSASMSSSSLLSVVRDRTSGALQRQPVCVARRLILL